MSPTDTSLTDTADAFIEIFTLEGAPGGPLAGLTFAAKDLYDVAFHPTGCGNPDWARTHPTPTAHAPAVAALLEAGATLAGKSHTDELAYSLMGVNAHTGTPLNSADPRRVPGGSSSGSAAAVAAGLVDIGLGSDTGGSVRMPGAFCGIYGLRTTHGRWALDATMPLAPSFDTVGWFTRDARTMACLLAALGAEVTTAPAKLLLPVDIWAQAEAATVDAMAPMLRRIEAVAGPLTPVIAAPDGIDTWFDTFRAHQAAEIWQTHGAWIEATRPSFGPGVKERFEMASRVTAEAWAAARATREAVAARMTDLTRDAVLVLPTGPGPAPMRDADEPTLDLFRNRALRMLCPAGLAGLPQLSCPAGTVDGGPVGLSLVGAAGSDRALVELAVKAGPAD